jgi:hypothetical protein
MSRESRVIHLTCGSTRSGIIRDALRLLGEDAQVIALSKDLSLGPINPPDPEQRKAWIRSVLHCPPGEHTDEEEGSWTRATAPSAFPVVWFFRSDVWEYASFLECAFRVQGRSFDVVDATGLDFVTERGLRNPWSIGLMSPGDIVTSGLYNRRRSLALTEVAAAAAQWAALRAENAPLRMARNGTILSVPLSHYDAFILDQATPDWEVAARLVGRTMTSLQYDHDPRGQSPSETVLFGRILDLADCGALDVKGPGPGMRDHDVRRKPWRLSVRPAD